MDEDLSIINSNTRNEKIKNFFVNNKNKIVSCIIILIIIIVGVFIYDKYLINKKKDISDKFNSITIDYSEKTKDKTTKSLIELISILNIEKGVNPSDEVTVEIKYASGEIKKIKTLCRIDTKNELEYYKNGGILQYVLRNMI